MDDRAAGGRGPMKMVARVLIGGGVGVVAVIAVALGPTLLRRDTVRYHFAGVLGKGALERPIGIALVGERLYVTDAGANRLVVLDTAGPVLAEWADSALGFGRPMHVSDGPGGLLYVAEYLNDRVTVLDSGGASVRRIGRGTGSAPGQLDAPGGAVARGDTVFVADFYNHRVQAFSPSGVLVIGRPGRVFGGRLHYPTDVAVADSLLYVADAYNNRIQVFRPDGGYVTRWGGPLGSGIPGPFRGWLRVATGIAVSGDRAYVADFYNHRVQIFTRDGSYLGQVADSLALPTDVAVAESGDLYVVDFGHQRVVHFEPQSPGS